MINRKAILLIGVVAMTAAGMAAWQNFDSSHGVGENFRRTKAFWERRGIFAMPDLDGNLISLSIGRKLTDADAQAFSQSVKVGIIVVSDKEFSDENLEYVARCGRIGVLDISMTNVTDNGLKFVAAINGLDELDVVDSLITPNAIQRFKRSRPRVRVWYSQRSPGTIRDGRSAPAAAKIGADK